MDKRWVGAFLIVVLSASVYFLWPENIKISVQPTYTDYLVWENDSWVLGAREYVYLYDGTTKMRALSREINSYSSDDMTFFIRKSVWKDNVSTIQTYKFNTSVSDVTLVPIENVFECFNCKDKIVQFDIRNLEYSGVTRDAKSPERFGHRIVVEWKDSYYAKIFQQLSGDKLIIKYKASKDYEAYHVRIFDPLITPYIVLNSPANNTNYSTTSIQLITFNFTVIDNDSAELNTTFYVNDIANTTNTSIANGSTILISKNFTRGTYNWSVNVTDGTNTNVSETRYFRVFQVSDMNISLNSNVNFTFLPSGKNLTQKNVSAQGQNSTESLFIVNNNLSFSVDVYINIGNTSGNYTMKCDDTSNVSNAFNLTTVNQTIITNLTAGNTSNIWCWVDYNGLIIKRTPEVEVFGIG